MKFIKVKKSNLVKKVTNKINVNIVTGANGTLIKCFIEHVKMFGNQFKKNYVNMPVILRFLTHVSSDFLIVELFITFRIYYFSDSLITYKCLSKYMSLSGPFIII